MKYYKCHRCELNFVLTENELCDVCKREMSGYYDEDGDLTEEFEGERLCPFCESAVLAPDEEICKNCKQKNIF
jgi:RNA polymerase subunit RPABC4/transcription elongation factor Spt4